MVARSGGRELIVEIKGYPDSVRTSVNTQARHYAAGALLTVLLAWADHPQASVGLVFPEATTYRNRVRRLRTPFERLDVSVWFVHQDGSASSPRHGVAEQPAAAGTRQNANGRTFARRARGTKRNLWRPAASLRRLGSQQIALRSADCPQTRSMHRSIQRPRTALSCPRFRRSRR